MNFDKEEQKANKKYEKFGLTENPFKIYYPTDSFTGWYCTSSNTDTREFQDTGGAFNCTRLKTTTIGKYWICTIKLPDDFPQKTKGFAYETMIMQGHQFHIPRGQESGGLEYQERCHTKDEAMLQHEKAVLYINKLMGK